VKEGEKTFLTELLKEGESIIDLKSGDLRKALRKGDKLTAKVLQEAAKYTGIAVANLVNILSPQTVVLGGGVMDALEDDLMPTILETARDYAMPGTLKDVEILASKLGDEAGITGAAVLVRQRLKLTD
jgi:glucokinase